MSAAHPTGPRPLRVVAMGGGHGLGATLAALRCAEPAVPGGLEITAVVTVADNGGSSGRLRRDRPVLPPGDLRMALVSLLDPEPPDGPGARWARLLQHRFGPPGELTGHPLGNLALLAAWEQAPDPVAGLDELAGLLGVRGRVLPACSVPLDIAADVQARRGRSVVTVRGQAEVALVRGRMRRVWLEPRDPPACEAAVAAVRAADWVLLGPGSWFTSVLPHLLVPALREAVTDGPGRVLVSLNLDPRADETADYPAAEHLAVLRGHAPALRPAVVLADPSTAGPPDSPDRAALADACAGAGSRLVVADVAAREPSGDPGPRHDSTAYARALAAVLGRPAGGTVPDPPS